MNKVLRRCHALIAGVVAGLVAGGIPGPVPGIVGQAWAAAESLPPRLDPELALAGEYQRARAARSNAALIGFIARHPEAEMSGAARAALMARRAPDAAPDPGPDGDIFMAFDQARLTRDPGALADFAARFAGHPLAAEAARPIWTAPRGGQSPLER